MTGDDFSEVLQLAADLSAAPAKALPNVRSALQFTATNIKKDWRKAAARTGLEGYAAAVDYDTKVTAQGVEAEIGPDPKKAQGMFGLVEDATGDVSSAPQHAGRDALRKNEDDFYKGLEIAISDVL